MAINFPATLDDGTSIPQVTDDTSFILAEHQNVKQEAILALEAKVGIDDSAVADTLDYLIKQAADPGHTHTGGDSFWARVSTTISPVVAGDNVTTSGNISTSGSGTITSAGLLTGSLGLAISGAITNINVNSNFATNIGSGTSTGAITIGNSSTGGALGLKSNAAITITGNANSVWDLGSAHTIFLQTTNNGPVTTGNGLLTAGGAFTSTGLITGSLGATISGATTSINTSSNFATNINTGTSTGAVSIGNSAAGAINITTNAASTHAFKPDTSSALLFTDRTTTYYALNTQVSTSGAIGHAFSVSAPTIPSGSSANYTVAAISPGTITHTGTTNMTGTTTSSQLGLLLNQMTLAGNGTKTISEAHAMYINGVPGASSSSGTTTISDSYGLRVGSGVSLNGSGGAVTRAYGLRVDLPSGAGSNYAAYFAGNVGIGQPSPTSLLELSSSNPVFKMTDSTSSAKSLSIDLDSNRADIRESAGASGSMIYLDLLNTRVAIGTTAPSSIFHVQGNSTFYSGGSGTALTFEFGRTGTDGSFNIAGGTGQYSNLVSAAGDMVFRNLTGHLIISAQNSSKSILFSSGGTGDTRRMIIDQNGNVAVGDNAGALTLGATNGFFYIKAVAGTPSGTPALSVTGSIPMVYDSTNNYLYFYNGSWKKSTQYS